MSVSDPRTGSVQSGSRHRQACCQIGPPCPSCQATGWQAQVPCARRPQRDPYPLHGVQNEQATDIGLTGADATTSYVHTCRTSRACSRAMIQYLRHGPPANSIVSRTRRRELANHRPRPDAKDKLSCRYAKSVRKVNKRCHRDENLKVT